MATESQQANPPGSPRPKIKYNLRTPLPLSASQEAEVKDLYHKRVRSYCTDEIRAFAECARNRTVTATWICRQQRLTMNGCMLAHAKPEEEDRAREEWFATVGERRRVRDEEAARVSRRKEDVVRMMKEDDERRGLGLGQGRSG